MRAVLVVLLNGALSLRGGSLPLTSAMPPRCSPSLPFVSLCSVLPMIAWLTYLFVHIITSAGMEGTAATTYEPVGARVATVGFAWFLCHR